MDSSTRSACASSTLAAVSPHARMRRRADDVHIVLRRELLRDRQDGVQMAAVRRCDQVNAHALCPIASVRPG